MEHVAFSPLNLAILFVYLGAMVFIGLRMAGRQHTTEDFFLAGRRMPWWVVGMSMYASLTSAVTYMGLPAAAYEENVSLIVVSIVSPLLAPVLILVFYPFYHRLRVTTSYEYIARRFGPPARYAVSGLFLLARVGWLGTVIYAPALALSIVSGLPPWLSILLMGAVATGYTALGGLAADLWTDVVQFVIMIGGAVWIAVHLSTHVPDGPAGILRIASDAGRLHVFDLRFSLFEMSGPIVAIAFFFQLMQEYGTDQTTVQRLLATPTRRGMSLAIGMNALVDFLVIGLLLFIGLGLFARAQLSPGLFPDGLRSDTLLPAYILHAMPDGVSGLMVTAIFAAAMSSMDSGISSLSTVVVSDFVRPLRRSVPPESSDLRLARGLTLLFGVLGTGAAFYVAGFEHLIKAYTSIISLFNGPILALFLLGILTRRARFAGWVVGAVLGIGATLWLQHGVKAHWAWYFPASFGVSFATGLLVSLVFRGAPPAPGLTLWDRRRGA